MQRGGVKGKKGSGTPKLTAKQRKLEAGVAVLLLLS